VGGRAAGLAYWLIEEGDYAEAGELVDEAISIRRKALGPQHPQVAGTITIKATLMLATGRFSEAYELAEMAASRSARACRRTAGKWLPR